MLGRVFSEINGRGCSCRTINSKRGKVGVFMHRKVTVNRKEGEVVAERKGKEKRKEKKKGIEMRKLDEK